MVIVTSGQCGEEEGSGGSNRLFICTADRIPEAFQWDIRRSQGRFKGVSEDFQRGFQIFSEGSREPKKGFSGSQ